MTYSYPVRTGSLGVMAVKIVNAGLPAPTGLSSDGTNFVNVDFASELTAAQKTTLDGLMASSTVGDIPASANSIYDFRDPLVFMTDFNQALAGFNLSCTAWPHGPGDTRLIFNKQLSAQELNRVQTAAWSSLMARIS